MAEHSSAVTRMVASPVPRRRRWLIGAVGALGAGGLVLGGVGAPVSAAGGNVAGNVHTSTEVDGGCVSVTAGTGDGEGPVAPVAHDVSGLRAAGHGTATVSACRDDLDGLVPGDPDGSVPDDVGGVEPGDLGDVIPGGPGGGGPSEPGSPLDPEELGAVIEAVEDVVRNGDGALPGDPAGELPGGLGGLVPAAPGTGPAGLLDRLAQIIPEVTGGDPGDDGGASGTGGEAAVDTSAGGSVTGAVAGAGEDAAGGETTDTVLEAGFDRGTPTAVRIGVVPGATLPKTGGGLGNGLLGLVAVLGAGRAVVSLVNRRYPAAGAGEG